MDHEGFEETEWYMIFLLERLRGLSLRDIAEWVGCSTYILHKWGKWKKFRDRTGPSYLSNKPPTKQPVQGRVYRYLDTCLRQGLTPIKPPVLADVFDEPADEVETWVRQWWEEIQNREHWPMCCICGHRGRVENPILENRACLECNAEMHGWPLTIWKQNGKFVALLHDWGLMPEETVADYIKEGARDTRDCTETYRQQSAGQHLVGAT